MPSKMAHLYLGASIAFVRACRRVFTERPNHSLFTVALYQFVFNSPSNDMQLPCLSFTWQKYSG